MLELNVPGLGTLALEHLALDLNGTIAVDGRVLPGVEERLAQLSRDLSIHLLSADTLGRGSATAARLGLELVKVAAGAESSGKRQFVERLAVDRVVAIGNGANDRDMLEAAELGVAVLGTEGLAITSLVAADVVVANVRDALDLLLHPQHLVATLRR